MNILLPSNYTVLSGYSLQARMLAPRLEALGHHVTVADIRAGSSTTAEIGGITVLSMGLDPLGNDIIPAHYQHSKADVVVTLCDAWGFSADTMRGLNWYPIAPIDHSPPPPAVKASLTAANGVIALSRFGQAELAKIGHDALYMPHMLDPKTWPASITRNDVMQARRAINLPQDAFIAAFVGVNDSNPSRKGIPELLAAWSIWQPKHPGSLLYLHTTPKGNMPIGGPKSGVDIDQIIDTFGIDPASLIMPDQYRMRTGLPPQELATMARAADVFILPSRGEGFGIPLIEFQHAGCPAITTDCAAGAELCASGWLIETEIEWSWQNATVQRPGIASIVEQLDRAYSERGNATPRVQAAQFAREFEADYVTSKYVAPVFDAIAQCVVLSQGIA